MKLVEQHIIERNDPRYAVIDAAAFASKNLLKQGHGDDTGKENSWQILDLAIQPDHVHLFVRSNPYTLPSDIARLIKGRSSHVLREEFAQLKRMPSLWTRSTFYSTAGNVSLEIIAQYIEKQSTE